MSYIVSISFFIAGLCIGIFIGILAEKRKKWCTGTKVCCLTGRSTVEGARPQTKRAIFINNQKGERQCKTKRSK